MRSIKIAALLCLLAMPAKSLEVISKPDTDKLIGYLKTVAMVLYYLSNEAYPQYQREAKSPEFERCMMRATAGVGLIFGALGMLATRTDMESFVTNEDLRPKFLEAHRIAFSNLATNIPKQRAEIYDTKSACRSYQEVWKRLDDYEKAVAGLRDFSDSMVRKLGAP